MQNKEREQLDAMESVKGFTLIELLVVISIIALLIGILLPALSAANKTAMAMKCASNQKQMAVAWFAYAVDHEGIAAGSSWSFDAARLVNPSLKTQHWYVTLFPYYGDNADLIQCPVAPIPKTFSTTVNNFGDSTHSWLPSNVNLLTATKDNYGGFGYNNWLEGSQRPYVPGYVAGALGYNGKDHLINRGIDANVPTSETPLFGDNVWADSGWPLESHPLPNNFEDPAHDFTTGGQLKRFCVNRHNMAINVAFLDGSTRRVNIFDLWSLKWHAKWDATDPPNLP